MADMSMTEAPKTLTVVSGADLTAHQYGHVVITAGVLQKAGAGATKTFILQNKPASGALGEIAYDGCTYVKVAAAIAQGGYIKSDGNGEGVEATADKDFVSVQLLAASTGANDLVPAIMRNFSLAA
jgi:hypothetical protein